METRTPRTPTGDSSSGYDEAPALNMVKVPCDPAQVIVNHASFRVQFPTAQPARSPRVARYLTATAAAPHPPSPAAARSWQAPPLSAAHRRAPVVVSGRSSPGDPDATSLLQPVRSTGLPPGTERLDGGGPAALHDTGPTQVIPRVPARGDTPTGLTPAGLIPALSPPRGPIDPGTTPGAAGPPGVPGARLLPELRPTTGAYDEPPPQDTGFAARQGAAGRHGGGHGGAYGNGYGSGYGSGYGGGYDDAEDEAYGPYLPYDDVTADADDGIDGTGDAGFDDGTGADGDGRRRGVVGARRRGTDPVRHAYYPGRRMNLGLVLLPLRVFLGFISLYAGMSKLCDPAYFDGDEHGSLVRSLHALHPWALAEPLRDVALQHPVGAGLTVAFLQVIVGALTVLGLWQRVAAVAGAVLAAALVSTVSWRSAPGYGAPDVIYLAAWSPLVIAGAPVYSVDGRLSSEAWRTLGPRAGLWDLRRRVVRRGALVAGLITGLTFLVGALLGGAVRDADRVTVPRHGEAPHNQVPGSPLPAEPGAASPSDGGSSPSASGSPTHGRPADPSEPPTAGASHDGTASADAGQPSESQALGTHQSEPHQPAVPQAPATSAGPSTAGGSASGSSGPASSSGSGSRPSGRDSRGGRGNGDSGDLVGGLLG